MIESGKEPPELRPATEGLRATAGPRRAAALLTLLIPGAGHAARGRLRRGMGWYGLMVALWLAAPWWTPLLAAWPVLWLACLVDAWRIRAADSELPSPGKTLLLLAAIFAGSLLLRGAIRAHYFEGYRIPTSGRRP